MPDYCIPTSSQTLTPCGIVFRTNSDAKSILLIVNDNIIYASEGRYGGFLLYRDRIGDDIFNMLASNPQMAENLLAWFVEPVIAATIDGDSVEKLLNVNVDAIRRIVEEVLDQLPDEVRAEFMHVEVWQYRYTRVKPVVKRVTDRYIVIDFEPYVPAQRVTALAVRLVASRCGSRRHPEGDTMPRLVKEWKLRYPDNPLVQAIYAESCTDSKCKCSAAYLKIVVEAPEALVAPATLEEKRFEELKREQEKTGTAVLVRGFLVISRLPSKALLDAHLPEIFKGVKVGKKDIKLVAGYFYNKLGTLSRKFYTQILPRYAIDAGFGYIVPYHKVGGFLRAVEELKREYEEYERQLKEFLLEGRIPEEVRRNKRAKIDPEYVKLVREYLEKHGMWEKVKARIESLSIADRVQIRLLPFAIDVSLVAEFVDEEVKERLRQEMEAFRREIAEAVKQQLRERVKKVLATLEELARLKTPAILERVKKEIEDIEKTASDLGVKLPELETLKEIAEASNVEELAKKIAEQKVTLERAKALLEEW